MSNGTMLLVATSKGVKRYNLSEPASPTFGGLVEGLTLADLRIPGRTTLEVTRTYSNAGVVAEGAMGAGWSHDYLSRVQSSGCAVSVIGADGTAQSS